MIKQPTSHTNNFTESIVHGFMRRSAKVIGSITEKLRKAAANAQYYHSEAMKEL